MSPPNGVNNANRTIRVRLTNSTGQTLRCGEARLNSGEWSSLPPDQIEQSGKAEFLILSNGGDVDGTLQLGPVNFRFFNPLLGSNTFSCSSPSQPQINCSITGGKGNDAVVDLSMTRSAAGATTHRGSSLEVAVPGRTSFGMSKASEAMPDNRVQEQTLASLNPPLSQQGQLRLREDVPRLDACAGNAARLQLKVRHISCQSVLEQLTTMSQYSQMRRCPVGWTVLINPDLNGAPKDAIFCYQASTATADRRTLKAFVYALPH
jgi:hypothetical protein